ncbi:CsbD family protein [Methylobacterium aquaticum]|uniref:CsbD family protein n=1 Tax=Methylobacterium aquaticum TaxID=270351 RepID=UPI0019324DBE|nr:CsbD family protein [Methylobacterium aquaticum]QRE77506.1 CsbD family protein [Methylobacterium aquaticum]
MVDTDRITGAAREIGGKAQAALGDLAGDRRAQVEGRFREAQGQAESLAGQARDGLRDAADTAIDYAEDAYERGRHAAQRGTRTVTHAVEETPLLALLVAGAVGYGLALLVHGRR